MRQSQSPARSPNSTAQVNRTVTSQKAFYRVSKSVNSDSAPLITRVLLFVFTGFLFGIALLYLIVGIIYLSIYYYPYSFTQFSTTLVAGLFIAWSGLLLFIVAANVFLFFTKRPQVVVFTAIAALVLFLVLVGIGIWGLAVSVGTGFNNLIRQGIYSTAKFYNAANPWSYPTASINWLQDTFNCCGIDSLQDWRIFYSLMYQQQASNSGYFPNQYNINYNTQLTSTVPDSCCVNIYQNCGQLNNGYYQSQGQWGLYGLQYGGSSNNNLNIQYGGGVPGQYGVPNGNSQYQYQSYGNINTQGCLRPYVLRYQVDLVFVAAFCFGVSVVGALLCLIYVGLFFFLRSRSS